MAIDIKEIRMRCVEMATSRIQPNRGMAFQEVVDLAEKFADYVQYGPDGKPSASKRGKPAKEVKDNSPDGDPLN